MNPALPEKAGAIRELRNLAGALGRFLTPSHKRKLVVVSLWACLVSLMEMLVAAAVIPYVQCLTGSCYAPVESVAEWLGLSSIALLSLGLLTLITCKLLLQAGFAFSAADFNQKVQRDTVRRLLSGYLHLDWMTFRSQHKAHYFRRCATTAVDAAWVTQQCVTMISSALLLLFLVTLMLWQYPLASLVLGAGFLLVNAVMQRLLGHAQKVTAHEREAALQRWNLGMSEAFDSFREIRVYRLERFFLEHFDRSISGLASANRKLAFYPALPRLILDFAIFGTLLLIVTLWLSFGRSLAELVPQLVFYAVVARVVLPAMMNLLSTRSALYGSIVNIELVLHELDQTTAQHTPAVGIRSVAGDRAAFTLKGVTFAHSPDAGPVLDDINLEIAHPSWVAVVGRSGAGKSTLLELLCGIHQPQQGEVLHHWPSGHGHAPRVAYLPQHVALLDGSILDNISFGLDAGDRARAQQVLELACLTQVVERLPGGLDARIGAEGGRLSGGERQRLALARALYRQPDLLLLDEATSGLDEPTEHLLLQRLRTARPDMTVVYITHRDANLRFADRVVRVAGARVQDDAGGAHL